MTPKQREIVEEVSRETGVPVSQIVSPSKQARIVMARIEVMKRLYALCYTTTQIGNVVGRDHTTVCYDLGLLSNRHPPARQLKWHRPRIRHLSHPVCPYCRVDPPPKLPKLRRSRSKQRQLIRYAGYDPRERQL